MKKIFRIIGILIVIFLVISLIWYVLVDKKYGEYEKGLKKSNITNQYYNNFDKNYQYGVVRPGFLRTEGNLFISDGKKDEISLIIWPNLITDGYEYGLRIQDHDTKAGYEILLNEKFEPIDKSNKKEMDIMKNQKKEIEKVKGIAKEVWNIK